MINHHLHIALAAERQKALLADASAHRLAREARPTARRRHVHRSWRPLVTRKVRRPCPSCTPISLT